MVGQDWRRCAGLPVGASEVQHASACVRSRCGSCELSSCLYVAALAVRARMGAQWW